jgi:hypothetical protein
MQGLPPAVQRAQWPAERWHCLRGVSPAALTADPDDESALLAAVLADTTNLVWPHGGGQPRHHARQADLDNLRLYVHALGFFDDNHTLIADPDEDQNFPTSQCLFTEQDLLARHFRQLEARHLHVISVNPPRVDSRLGTYQRKPSRAFREISASFRLR